MIILSEKLLFIKLGEGGQYEKECITINQYLKLGYIEAEHELCILGDWEKVHNYYINNEQKSNSVATFHVTQIKEFYTADEHTLWITFYANKLWWCFSKPSITLHPDGTKTRPVIGTWSDQDINGKTLSKDTISGNLLKTEGFRGTICKIAENHYALAKINGKQSEDILAVELVVTELKKKLAVLIRHLQWKDFEVLIDLIFRQAGWQRIGITGKTQKTLDLDLLAPVTGERAIVQIKSQSDLKEFRFYANEFANMTNCDKFFFIVHSPEKDLTDYIIENDIKLYFVDKIAELSISSGLIEWIIKKTS